MKTKRKKYSGISFMFLIIVCMFLFGGGNAVQAQDYSVNPTGLQKVEAQKEGEHATGPQLDLSTAVNQALRKKSLAEPAGPSGTMKETESAYRGNYYHDDVGLGWDADKQ